MMFWSLMEKRTRRLVQILLWKKTKKKFGLLIYPNIITEQWGLCNKILFLLSKSVQTLFTEVIYLCRPGDPSKTKWYTFFSCCCINHLRENNCWNMLREVIKQKEKSRSCSSSVATTFVSKTDAAISGLTDMESLTKVKYE